MSTIKAVLRDVPVNSQQNEFLGLAKHAKALADFIRTCETPMTIGIQGDWGIGKTSLLNMIRESLSSDPYPPSQPHRPSSGWNECASRHAAPGRAISQFILVMKT